MENKEIKKRSFGILITWLFIALTAAIGAFLLCAHFTKIITSISPVGNSAATSTIAMQEFSGDGFSFSVPESWYIENNGEDSVAAYPDYSPSAASSTASAMCKIEVSVFPYAASSSTADWISDRLGADPSAVVAEQSSADIAIDGGTGVQWNGTIDGVPTTIAYAFSDSHALEIAPSVVNEASDDSGNAVCADALNLFLSKLTLE